MVIPNRSLTLLPGTVTCLIQKMVTHNRNLTLLLDTIYKKWLYIIGVLHLTLLPDTVTCLIQNDGYT